MATKHLLGLYGERGMGCNGMGGWGGGGSGIRMRIEYIMSRVRGEEKDEGLRGAGGVGRGMGWGHRLG
jgi:hypothetical protein